MAFRPTRATTRWALLWVAAAVAAGTATAGNVSWEAVLAPAGEPGVQFILEGRVLDARGAPLRNAVVFAYHADDAGNYTHPGEQDAHLRGLVRTNVLGAFRFVSVLPGTAEGIPHVHFEYETSPLDHRAETITLARREGAGSDTTFARLPYMLDLPSPLWTYVRRNAAGAFHVSVDLKWTQGVRTARSPSFTRALHMR